MTVDHGRRRADLLALALVFAIITLFFADVIFLRATFFIRDVSIYHFPMKRVVAEALRSGDFLRQWNPLLDAGQPLAANPAYEWFYPPQWLVALLPFDAGFRLHIVLHLYLAAAGMYLLARSLPVSIPAAVFASLAFSLGGPLLSLTNLLPFLFSYAWLPLTFCLARMALRSGSRRAAAGAALVLSMQFLVGEPVVAAQTSILLAGYAIYAASEGGKLQARRLVKQLALVAAIGAGAFCLAAAQLLPAVDFARDTHRAAGLDPAGSGQWSFPLMRAGELIYPHLLGAADNFTAFYWGAALYPKAFGPFIFSIYAGLLTVIFFFVAVWLRLRGALVACAGVVIGLLIAAGSHTPLFTLLLRSGVAHFIRYPEKFVLAPLFVLVVIAARGYDAVSELRANAPRIAMMAAGATGLFALILFGATFVAGYEQFFQRFFAVAPDRLRVLAAIARDEWLIAAVRAAVCAGAVAAAMRTSRYRHALLIAFLVLELGAQSNQLIPRAPSDFYSPPPVVGRLHLERGGRIFNEADFVASGLRGNDEFWLSRNSLAAPFPMAWGYGVAIAEDIDETQLLYTHRFFDIAMRAVKDHDERLLALLMNSAGVDVRLLPLDAGDALRRAGEASAIDAVTVEHRGQMPKAYFPDSIVVAGTDSPPAGAYLAARGRWPAVVARRPPVEPGGGQITATSAAAESLDFRTVTNGPRLMVVSQTFHRYWHAAIDGGAVPILRVNTTFQGIVVPPGEHSIALRYHNPLFAPSAALSIVALLTIGALLVVPRRPLQQ